MPYPHKITILRLRDSSIKYVSGKDLMRRDYFIYLYCAHRLKAIE